MDMKKTGQLIRCLRRELGITQKDLAEELHVTDKAVSKWERGLSCPDVSLLSPLAARLGVSVEELLQGGTGTSVSDPSKVSVLEKTSFTPRRRALFQKYAPRIYILLLLISGVICVICDWAISGALTWSLYPILSFILAGVVFFPLLACGAQVILYSLIALSLGIFPFLFSLRLLLPEYPLLLPIGIRMAGIALVFFWCAFALFRRLVRHRLLALSCCLLLCMPTHFAVDFSLSRLIDTPLFDIWDALSWLILMILAAIFFHWDRRLYHTPSE